MNLSSSKSTKRKGQGLVEYALILVLVAIVVIAVLMALGPGIGSIFSSINNSMSGIAGGGGQTQTCPAGDHCGNPGCSLVTYYLDCGPIAHPACNSAGAPMCQ